MAQVATCLICDGKGEVEGYSTLHPEVLPCHGCGGKGWVTVHESMSEIPSIRDPEADPARIPHTRLDTPFGHKVEGCPECHGMGVIEPNHHLFGRFLRLQHPSCPNCAGTGQITIT